MRKLLIAVLGSVLAASAVAKLPPPSDEAKAKAAEAAAKTAHGGKVEAFLLCRSMERVAARYQADAAKAGKTVNKATETPACADPGPFVPAGTAAAPAAAPAAPAKAAAPAAAPAKKT
ncbi:hypothetical protein HZ992_05460 [Rhizobacter sp. AJA081-3]|uniref:hypothetical protein n=1 Tax=Rhizobacter sp. AJA081-3 TaxID=2753607 RepID=UPI001AE0B6BD|nr:hypothetical protein [Rhizobacter sp. AJA081-3]QTN24444.1 hypothetical protein HZ992_05460 [Rhizobacter sp. AJA081-3]